MDISIVRQNPNGPMLFARATRDYVVIGIYHWALWVRWGWRV